MKIKQILEEDDKFPLSSIDRATISKVGEIKDGKTGKFQCITISDGSHKLPVYIYNEENMNLIAGEEIEFKSGPPVNSKPTGLIVRKSEDGKVRVNATDRCIVKVFNSSEDEKEEETQLTEPVSQDCDPIPEGPSDGIIRECFMERLHILRILEQMNQDHFSPFSQESLYPMVTSIIIDASRSGNKILPKIKPQAKERFAPIDKKHNPPKAESHPTDKADEPEEGETKEESLVKFLNDNRDTIKALNEKTKNGTILSALSNRESRVKAMQFYLARRSQGGDIDSKMYMNLNLVFSEMPSDIKLYAVYEAIFFSQVDLGHITLIDITDNELKDIAGCYAGYMANVIEKFAEGIPPKELWKVYKPYFSAPVDQRFSEIPF